ncbi:hypothetical protein EKG37_06405 [Robertmurraya yapensis]|uniref:Uncharacterized protein n=2 Tax=Bacillaceae TaxID=186817 RepID=A0A3S0KT56_9BACI|nr:hypothetical protein [Bacillus yapensis]RTR33849.1 hypothetical protein EKG37_06405 [Bacillus yapensis]TKS97167.1 hypothetical protein FAR12_06405 [Bacillus yapensis]
MEFVVYFFLVWLYISIFAVLHKRLNIVENTFVYLVILIISINYSWLVIDEFNVISLSEKRAPYLAYLINRSIGIPILTLIFVNLYTRIPTLIQKAMLLVSAVILFVALASISTSLKITKYLNWNYGFDFIYYFVLMVCAIGAYKIMHRVMKGVVEGI